MVFAILFLLSVLHTVFVFTGINTITFYYVLNPLIYAALWLLFCLRNGFGVRRSYKGQHAALAVGMGFSVYITAYILAGFFFGFARNMMVRDAAGVFRNILIYGSVAVFAEMLRFRLIRESKNPLITVVFIFLQISSFTLNADTFFSVIAPVIVLNIVLSYMAAEGTLLSLVALRGVSDLVPVVIPALPAVEKNVWSLIVQMFLFLTVVAYRYLMPQNERAPRELKKPFLRKNAALIVAVGIFAAFNMGIFPIFTSIILTDSMAGVLDKGSVAVVRKINENSFRKLSEGDIIQFRNERNLLVIHRITEVHYGLLGEPYFITKGDANEREDTSPVKKEQIRGVVMGSFKYIGLPRVWVNQLLR